MYNFFQMSRFLIPLGSLTLLCFYLIGCNTQARSKAEQAIAVANQNKTFIQSYTDDFWNTHNLAAIDAYYSRDFIMHSANENRDFNQHKQLCNAYFKAFPDLHIATANLFAEGDKVAKTWTATGTYKADFMGIPATGKKLSFKGLEICRIKEGKIAEIWIAMDQLGIMQQLGVIPTEGK